MTFPTAVKKSGPITIPKTGSGSNALSPRSPSSPRSPLNTSAKMILPGSSVKASLASKVPEKANAGSTVKKPSVPLKSLSTVKSVSKPVINAKSESEKTVASAAKGVTKSVTKPPPLDIKVMDVKGLQSPKTPTSTIKSQTLTKSTTAAKPASKSTGVVRSPSITKPSQASVSSPIAKSPQVTTGVKSLTISSVVVKSTSVSSPVAKSPPTSVLSKRLTINSTVPKSPSRITNSSTLTVKPVSSAVNKESSTSIKSKEQVTVVKPTTPVKKAAISSVKSSTGVKSASTSTNKPLTIPRSPSTASSIKSISLKTPNSPSKLSTKEPSNTTEISIKSVNKSSVTSKSSPTTKAIVNKESSTLSLLSVKSSSTMKTTTTISAKTSTLKANVTSLSSSVNKNLVPKSPVAKTKPLAVVKVPSSPTVKIPPLSIVKTPSSPIVKTPSSPIVRTPSSPIVKTLSIATKTPSSPTLKTRTSSSPTVKARTTPSSSLVKPPLSPAVRKMVPTKLILSPGMPKSKSLSSSRLSSVSTESLASRTSLKSPMSPRPTKAVTKSPSKIIKKTEEPKVKGIRGGQPIKKTIEIPGITELPSNTVLNQQETLEFNFKLDNVVESVLKEETESTNAQIPDHDSPDFEKLETRTIVENVDDGLEMIKNSNDEDALSNVINAQNVCQNPEMQDNNLETIEEDSVEPSTILLLNEQKQEDVCILLDFEVVKKDECVPHLNSISQSDNNFDIAFDDNHFNRTNENVIVEQSDETQSCIIDMDDHFEPMNDKLVLGDVPFETDSSLGDISDNEQTIHKEVIANENDGLAQIDCVDDVFIFTDNLSINSADSNENFIHQFMPKSIKQSEGSSSVSTDDGSRKSYSEAVSGSPKDGEFYFDYDFEMVDDCLDYDEGRSVFVEVTEKEFPELKPKDLSGKRRRNKKQKKRNYSTQTESQSGKY